MNKSLRIIFVLVFSINLDLVKAETCTIEATGQSGECKFMSDCPVVQNDYQKTRKMPTICDLKYRTVCCPNNAVAITTTVTQTFRRASERKCREYGQNIYENYTVPNSVFGEPPIVKTRNVCGHKTVELIVGGVEAGEKEFPHMVLIGYKNGGPEDYQCGGSLISSDFVLTAAHCSNTVDGPAKFAKMGNVVRNLNNLNTWTYNINQRIIHPNYNSRHAEDDIALLKLDGPVRFNSYVIPICLPQTGVLNSTKKVIASGWGRTGFAEDASELLMKVTIDYFNKSRCEEVYEDDEKLDGKGINWSKMICAGSTNKTGDTCNGDSGGPIQIFNSDVECMYTIVGVTSFGSIYCGAIGVPAIYTKVYYYLDWIESIVWPNI